MVMNKKEIQEYKEKLALRIKKENALAKSLNYCKLGGEKQSFRRR